MTEGAAQAIQDLVEDRPGAGLRIFTTDRNQDALEIGLSISNGPEPTDEVVSRSGAQVFIQDEVAPVVDGRILDAEPADGKVKFSFLT